MQQMPPVIAPVPPPETPPGWQTGPPDFVGVGTMRSGTSWWWRLLIGHPRFARADSYKELHFFDHLTGVTEIDKLDYYRYFAKPAGSFTGEWTPRYMYDFWVPPMLRQVAPDTRILVMLRDPVERYLSGMAFTAARGFPASHAMMHYHYERSLYGQQLATLLRHFPQDQVLVLQYERCVAQTEPAMRETLEFIGADPQAWQAPRPPTERVNGSKVAKPELSEADIGALTDALSADMAQLFAMFPKLDPSIWPAAVRAMGA
jgi:hypothetical protein